MVQYCTCQVYYQSIAERDNFWVFYPQGSHAIGRPTLDSVCNLRSQESVGDSLCPVHSQLYCVCLVLSHHTKQTSYPEGGHMNRLSSRGDSTLQAIALGLPASLYIYPMLYFI